MKKYFVLLWLLLPLPAVVFHYGPGQRWLARDRAHGAVRRGQAMERAGHWQEADRCYQQAVSSLGNFDPGFKLRVKLARARVHYRHGNALPAMKQAAAVVNDPGFHAMPAGFRRESRELNGHIHYYAGWVMRLEGARRDLWMEQAELARQNFRLLAEDDSLDPAETRKQELKLEAAVTLERLSLYELMAKPLPREGRTMAGQGLSEQVDEAKMGQAEEGEAGEGSGITDRTGEEPGDGASSQRFQPGGGS